MSDMNVNTVERLNTSKAALDTVFNSMGNKATPDSLQQLAKAVTAHSALLKEVVTGTDSLNESEKTPVLTLLDAVLQSAELNDNGKITHLSLNAIMSATLALESAMLEAEMNEISDDVIITATHDLESAMMKAEMSNLEESNYAAV